MSWYEFLSEWRKKHPKVSYREALKKASKEYQREKDKRKYLRKKRMNSSVSFSDDIYLKNILIQHEEEAKRHLISIFYSTGVDEKEAEENFHTHMKILKEKEHQWRKLKHGTDEEKYFLRSIEDLEKEYALNKRQRETVSSSKRSRSVRKDKTTGSTRNTRR